MMKKPDTHRISLFGDEDNLSATTSLNVVELEFVQSIETPWHQLFSGFHTLRAITYSSSIYFMTELFTMFEDVEVILGSDKIIHGNLEEVIAYQQETTKLIRDLVSKKANKALLDRVEQGRLRFYISREYMSHEKIYVLQGDDDKQRVIMGSANMSRSAFTGLQRENICFMDDYDSYAYYLERFTALKETCADNLSSTAVIAEEDDSLTDVPLLETVRAKTVVIIEPVANPEGEKEIQFTLNLSNRKKRISSIVPNSDKGRVKLTPDVVRRYRRNYKAMNAEVVAAKEEQSPRLFIDVENQVVTLNDVQLDLKPSWGDVENDVACLIEYIEGFHRFHGDTREIVRRYYTFINWVFVSPFMAVLRDTALRNNRNVYPYPVFGLLYGKSKGGKTSFLETLTKLMIGQKLTLSADKFTRTNVHHMKETVQGVPIVIDDLAQNRYTQHAPEIIKNERFGLDTENRNYPAVIISANEDVKVVLPEIARRTVTCHIQGGLTNMEIMKSSIVQRTQATIGTSLYRHYLGEMLVRLPAILDQLKGDAHGESPDVLGSASQILLDIFSKGTGERVPEWVRELSLRDYFDEQITRRALIEQILREWRVNRSSFHVLPKANELRYDAGDYFAAQRLVKELPENLQAKVNQTLVVMDLAAAQEFFRCEFAQGFLSRMFSRKG